MNDFAATQLTTYTEVDSSGREWKVTVLESSYTEEDLKIGSLSAPISKRGEREQAGISGIKGTTRDFI